METDYEQLPLKDSLDDYIENGTPVGGFLHAVLSNNLFQAVGRADLRNLEMLPLYVRYLHNCAPMRCHGSPQTVESWLDSFLAKEVSADG